MLLFEHGSPYGMKGELGAGTSGGAGQPHQIVLRAPARGRTGCHASLRGARVETVASLAADGSVLILCVRWRSVVYDSRVSRSARDRNRAACQGEQIVAHGSQQQLGEAATAT